MKASVLLALLIVAIAKNPNLQLLVRDADGCLVDLDVLIDEDGDMLFEVKLD